ncbi:hypothetical protein Ndes2437A_g08753 [Nannochloris sp. 'desiccata']
MPGSATGSMRRGWKSALLGMGAIASVPTAILIADDYIDRTNGSQLRRHQRAKIELWKEDAEGFIITTVDRISNSVGRIRSPRKETPSTTTAPENHAALPFPIPLEEALEDRLSFKKLGLDPPTALLAQEFSPQVLEIRKRAESLSGGPLPLPRFTDSELMRYAIHHGFLRAHGDAARQRALHHAALAAAETARWIINYPFASENQLQRFSHLIWWTQSPTTSRPVLNVDIGRAVHECRGPEAVAFANAVVTHVERAVHTRLEDAPKGHDRVDVVVYAAGTSAFSASRAARVLRSVVTTLSHHYPGRLHELTLLDLPRVLLWLVTGAKKLVHKETAKKVVLVSSIDWKKEDLGDGDDDDDSDVGIDD